MKIALGVKAHSGWAALVAVGRTDGAPVVVDRRRIELMDEPWKKHPYHAAEKLKPEAARALVERGIDSAHRLALREMQAALEREQGRGNEVMSCAVLLGNPMPGWSIDEIRAVHFRMHKAEGALFRDALVAAVKACELRLAGIPEKLLTKEAEKVLGESVATLAKLTADLGKSVGPPWGKDQKDAALAALVALQTAAK